MIPFKLFSQDSSCVEQKEPVSWIRKEARIDIDLYDVFGIIDTSMILNYKLNLPISARQFIGDSAKTYFLKLVEGDILSSRNQECILTLLVVNNTDSMVEVTTLDGTLLAIPEIYYNKKWYPIEYHMIPGCGNSYYDIPLKSGKCYKVNYKRYIGSEISKLRYKLKLKDKYIVSNSIDSRFNIEQIIFNNNQIGYKIIDFKD